MGGGLMTDNEAVRRDLRRKATSKQERRKSMRRSLLSVICTAAIAAVTYVTPSLAQTVALGNSPTVYAREALAGNPELTLRADGNPIPRNAVTISYATIDVAPMRTADITFELNGGAMFAAAPTALVLSEGGTTGAPISANISQSFVSGSAAGSSSVTYRVSTVAALTVPNTVLRFNVPKLSNAASILRGPDSDGMPPALTMRVTVTPSSADALQARKFPQFPAEGSAATAGVVTLATGRDFISLASITPAAGATSTAPVISLSDRTSLTEADSTGSVGSVRAISGFPGGASRNAAIIGKADLSYTQFLREPDATRPGLTPNENNFLAVTVTGDFEDGDVLTFSPDAQYRAAQALSISGRVATLRLGLGAAIVTTTPTSRTLYYFPASGTIRQKAFSIAFSLSWQSSSLAARDIPAGSTRVEYAGIGTMAFAYGIPNPGNADRGYLRLRCQSATPCSVFFSCLDQGGGRVGDGNLKEVSVRGRSVAVYDSRTSLPEALGVRGWSGRLSCNVMSSSDLAVQLMVRSGSVGTLTNNTYISGVDQNPSAP